MVIDWEGVRREGVPEGAGGGGHQEGVAGAVDHLGVPTLRGVVGRQVLHVEGQPGYTGHRATL